MRKFLFTAFTTSVRSCLESCENKKVRPGVGYTFCSQRFKYVSQRVFVFIASIEEFYRWRSDLAALHPSTADIHNIIFLSSWAVSGVYVHKTVRNYMMPNTYLSTLSWCTVMCAWKADACENKWKEKYYYYYYLLQKLLFFLLFYLSCGVVCMLTVWTNK